MVGTGANAPGRGRTRGYIDGLGRRVLCPVGWRPPLVQAASLCVAVGRNRVSGPTKLWVISKRWGTVGSEIYPFYLISIEGYVS